MKELLFIVYFFPPMGGSGVQRPLKYVKYLNKFGWKPIILVPEPGRYHRFDRHLADELEQLIEEDKVVVYRVPGGTPLHWGTTKKQWNPRPLVARFLRRLSLLFLLPDNKKGWVPHGLAKVHEIMASHDIKAIYATAPPYSNLMLASEIKKMYELPLIYDFRDDWLESHLIRYPSFLHRYWMKHLENKTLKVADTIIAINKPIKEAIEARHPLVPNYRIQPHGYDPEDFDDIPASETNKQTIKFLYSGTFYDQSGPETFLRAIRAFLNRHSEWENRVELHFQGSTKDSYEDLLSDLSLHQQCYFHGYVNHLEAVRSMQNADVLWLNNNHKQHSHTITLSKTYEYMASGKPILALIPEGDTKNLLHQYGRSFIAKPDSIEEAYTAIEKLMKAVSEDSLPEVSHAFVKQFDREKIAQDLALELDALTQNS
jgi:glycosyltransferase involved in cell wall biosynthesis